jgi:hypothetical protein
MFFQKSMTENIGQMNTSEPIDGLMTPTAIKKETVISFKYTFI